MESNTNILLNKYGIKGITTFHRIRTDIMAVSGKKQIPSKIQAIELLETELMIKT